MADGGLERCYSARTRCGGDDARDNCRLRAGIYRGDTSFRADLMGSRMLLAGGDLLVIQIKFRLVLALDRAHASLPAASGCFRLLPLA